MSQTQNNKSLQRNKKTSENQWEKISQHFSTDPSQHENSNSSFSEEEKEEISLSINSNFTYTEQHLEVKRKSYIQDENEQWLSESSQEVSNRNSEFTNEDNSILDNGITTRKYFEERSESSLKDCEVMEDNGNDKVGIEGPSNPIDLPQNIQKRSNLYELKNPYESIEKEPKGRIKCPHTFCIDEKHWYPKGNPTSARKKFVLFGFSEKETIKKLLADKQFYLITKKAYSDKTHLRLFVILEKQISGNFWNSFTSQCKYEFRAACWDPILFKDIKKIPYIKEVRLPEKKSEVNEKKNSEVNEKKNSEVNEKKNSEVNEKKKTEVNEEFNKYPPYKPTGHVEHESFFESVKSNQPEEISGFKRPNNLRSDNEDDEIEILSKIVKTGNGSILTQRNNTFKQETNAQIERENFYASLENCNDSFYNSSTWPDLSNSHPIEDMTKVVDLLMENNITDLYDLWPSLKAKRQFDLIAFSIENRELIAKLFLELPALFSHIEMNTEKSSIKNKLYNSVKKMLNESIFWSKLKKHYTGRSLNEMVNLMQNYSITELDELWQPLKERKLYNLWPFAIMNWKDLSNFSRQLALIPNREMMKFEETESTFESLRNQQTEEIPLKLEG